MSNKPVKKPGFQKGQVANPKGRGKGTKNKMTIFKEAMMQGAEEKMIKSIEQITEVVCKKAAEGDLTAAKMVLDRLIPIRKAVDINHGPQKDLGINIVINSLEDKLNVKAEEVVEAEYEDLGPTKGEVK